ncbi:MAG: hypothetical protein ACE37H_11135 [Phycisphaeraceae bacterium]
MKIGMAIGMAISGTILAVVVLVLFMNSRPGGADEGSGNITDTNLAEQKLPDGLPSFELATNDQPADADALVKAGSEADRLSGGGIDLEEYVQLTQPVIDTMIAAAGGSLEQGFIDKRTPAKRFESPEVKNAMIGLQKAVSEHIKLLIEQGQYNAAREIASAYHRLGKQMFEKNVRLKARQRGLLIMRSAVQNLGRIGYEANADGVFDDTQYKAITDDTGKWLEAIKQIDDTWNSKLKTTESINAEKDLPNISDLVKIANEDKDRTFRVYAALRLGYAVYERGDPGNQEAINAALDKLENSDDKMVAEAAKAGRSIKDKDEYYSLR